MPAAQANQDDRQLLQRYVVEGSDAAFAELVRRHVDMVFSTAVRRVNGDAALAQDVTQMVFADLARKARLLPDDVVLGGWLHRHTGFTASKAVDRERRRRNREKEAALMNAMTCSSADPLWHEVAPLLDDALDRLPDPDRNAIVLRFFERRELRAVGAALGVSDDTAQKRVSRALDKLRDFLSRRGVTSTAGALSAVLTAQAVGAAPPALATTLPGSALAMAAGSGSGWSVALGLFSGASRLKLAASLALLAGCAAAMIVQYRTVLALREELRRREASPPPIAVVTTKPAPAEPASEPSLPDPGPSTIEDIVAAAARELRGGAQGVSATTRALGLLSQIAAGNIPEALAKVRGVSDEGAQALLYKYLLGRWAETQPFEALQYSQNELPMMCRPGVYEGILTAWAGKNPESAFAWFQKGGDSAAPPVRESLLATLFRGLASQDFAKAVQHLNWLPNENERAHALRGMLQTVATADDRERALAAISKIDDEDSRVQARRAFVEHWAGQDAQAAATWVEKIEPAWERTRLMDSLGMTWLQSHPTEAADWWLARAPGGETLIKIMNVWAHNDPNAAGEWLGRQPPGPDTDMARLTFARQITDTDPVSAFAWADTITDPALRESTVDHVFQSWRQRDPASAINHLGRATWTAERRTRLQNLAP